MGWWQTLGRIKHRFRLFPSFLWRGELKFLGVTWASKPTLCGRPFVSRFPGSKIEWGNSVVLDSSRRANPLGGDKPCVLRTMSPQARILLGDFVGLSSATLVAGNSIEIGSGTLVGAGCMIIDNDFHVADERGGWRTEYVRNSRPIKIGRGCFLGARSIILKGVQLGDGVVIGAGSVVTRNVPDACLVAGNPAQIIRTKQATP